MKIDVLKWLTILVVVATLFLLVVSGDRFRQPQPPPTQNPWLLKQDAELFLFYDHFEEHDLRAELVMLDGDVLRDPSHPVPFERKAMVARMLTKWDAKHGTNHWDRAAVHYAEAIERWQVMAEGDDQRAVYARFRVAVLRMYRAYALEKDGCHQEAEAERGAAAKHPAVRIQR